MQPAMRDVFWGCLFSNTRNFSQPTAIQAKRVRAHSFSLHHSVHIACATSMQQAMHPAMQLGCPQHIREQQQRSVVAFHCLMGSRACTSVRRSVCMPASCLRHSAGRPCKCPAVVCDRLVLPFVFTRHVPPRRCTRWRPSATGGWTASRRSATATSSCSCSPATCTTRCGRAPKHALEQPLPDPLTSRPSCHRRVEGSPE